MATILLGLAGASLGGIFGPIGAIVGRAAGALIGSIADRAIVSALTPPARGPRLTTTDIQTSTEGSPVNRLYGRARVSGQVIWATRFEETMRREGGGKGFGPRIETYTYFGNFAVGLCEGPIAGIGRIWADGKEIDQAEIEFRVHPGTEDQQTDPLIEAKEEDAPAYRGLAYIVFERLDLTDFGNRLPQISVEVLRPTGRAEQLVRGAALMPGNEFGFDTIAVNQVDGRTENRHTLVAGSDIEASVERLLATCPNLSSVLLVVSWFGDDLRAGSCTIHPKVDDAGKQTRPVSWACAGLARAGAAVVSQVEGKPAFGGSPSDAGVIRCIQMLKARGLDVCLMPFLMMDVASDNTLPDPYSDNAVSVGQPTFPWRGRITVSPAAGYAGSVDKTATAATQVASFMGSAAAIHFGGSGTTVTYSGPAEWRYRRFVLHYARLAQLAGGVESFLIGSEMVGLTGARSSASAYPMVSALIDLAGEARMLLGAGVKIGYAADWSEYHSHRPADGSGDLYFNLDPLWADDDIDFIGVSNYLPLADWRDGTGHADFDPAGPTAIHDQAYLGGNVRGGEHFDWYYADDAARIAQARTPITDGAYGEPWVFRQKALREWWENPHHNRPGGTRAGSPTAWTPEAKPFRFVEYGCPAVDKGANQPNVFPDPLSSEGGYPHFSSRARDDRMQRAWIEAMLSHYIAVANNPVSGVYGGLMVDNAHCNAWAWDTRPWPSFPLDATWGDWEKWFTGHWLSGRLGAAPADATIAAILDEAGFSLRSIDPIAGIVDGVTVGGLMSPRALLDALRPAFRFDAVESGGLIRFLDRGGRAPVAEISADELVVADDARAPLWRRTRLQETDLPTAVKLRYGDAARDDRPAGAEARRSAGGSRRVMEIATPVVMAETRARELAELELHAAWVARERAAFSLPPSRLALDPGDIVTFQPTGKPVRIESIGQAGARRIEAFEVDPLAGGTIDLAPPSGLSAAPVAIVPAEAVIADCALLSNGDVAHAPYVAGLMSPFGGGLALYRSASEAGFELDGALALPGSIGATTEAFWSGPTGRWDRVNTMLLDLKRGSLASAEELAVLNGANVLMIENPDGEWEVLQFATAAPLGGRSWTLANLLRGQRGTEHAMRDPIPAGARVLVIDPAVSQSSIPTHLVGLPLNWRVGPAAKAPADPAYVQQTRTVHGRGLRPLSPAHLRGSRNPTNGNWTITWIRRTRIGGDGRELAEVPLGEEAEGYRLEILDGPGGAVKRVFETTAPSQTYTASQQNADFGGLQWSFHARVAQRATAWGPGIFNEALIWVR